MQALLVQFVNSHPPEGSAHGGYALIVLAVAVFLVEGLVILHRVYGKLPADIDRVGSELNLVGYGVAVGFLVSIFLNVAVLPRFPAKSSGAFIMSVLLFFLFNLYAYGFNLRISELIRSSASLQHGIRNGADLKTALRSPRELFLLSVSLTLGLIPTIACFAAQIYWG